MGSKPSVARKEVEITSTGSSSDPVEFYWDPVSPPSRCVHMTLKALGEKFVEKRLELFKGETKTPEFLKINPAGKVPAIKVGSFTMSESRAIACYLCNKYNTPISNKLYPKDAQARAEVDRLLLLSDDVQGAIMKQIKLFEVMFGGGKPDEDQLPEAAKGLKMCADFLGDKRFLAGNNVTIADFFMATAFILYDMATDEPVQDKFYGHEGGDKVSAWMKRVRGLPYFDESVQDKFYGHEGGDKVSAWMKRVRGLPYFDEVNKDANEKLESLYRAKLEE